MKFNKQPGRSVNISEFIIPARVIDEDDETMTLLVPKNSDHKFNLSEDPRQNQFNTITFIRNKDGRLDVYKPWSMEHKGL